MEQKPNYNLLQAIDPTKIKVPISERFAKLTLSSNKKQQEKCDQAENENQYKIQKENRDSVTRNISKQFENEIQAPTTNTIQNPLLRSESSKETEKENSLQKDTISEEHSMEPLEVSLDAEEKNDAEQFQDCVELLSQKIASLMMEEEPKPISLSSGSTDNVSVALTDYLTSESQPSSISETEKIRIIHHIPINIKEAANRQTFALNLSPSSSSSPSVNENLEKTYQMSEEEGAEEQDKVEDGKDVEEDKVENEDEDSEEEDEDEAITISDTTDSNHESAVEIMAISSLPSLNATSENLSLPSLVADKAERVAAFLRDVSMEHRARNEQGQLIVNDTVDRILDNREMDQIQANLAKAKQIATADTESMTADVELELASKPLKERESRLNAVKDLDLVKDTNDETLDNTINANFDNGDYNKENTPKVLSNLKNSLLNDKSPKTPKACAANVYKLANDETQCNTETPKILANKDNQYLDNSRNMANLDTEDVTEMSFKENKISDPCRLANDDTLANTNLSYTDPDPVLSPNCKDLDRSKSSASIQSTPNSQAGTNQNQNSYYSLIKSMSEELNGSVPEASITILETDDEENPEEKEKSNTENESLDNKLSNSFLREESTDDSEYEQKLSKIQMSMANINISAKINIKIHIPINTSSTSDTTEDDEPHDPDNAQRLTQPSKQLTDQTVKSPDDKLRLNKDHNNKANEILNETGNSKIEQIFDEENSNNLSLDKDKENSEDEESNNKSVQFDTSPRTCKQQRQTKSVAKGKIRSTANESSDSSVEIVEDEKFVTEAEKLLTQLYGQSWQTPDVIRTLKRHNRIGDTPRSSRKQNNVQLPTEENINKKPLVEESVLDDFSMFRCNIVKTNLDSTRLDATPKSNMQHKIKISTEPKNGKKSSNQKGVTKIRPQTERKPRVAAAVKKVAENKRRAVNDRWRQLIDNEANSGGDNASDDTDADLSWSKNASELEICSSDSEFEISPKTKKAKSGTTKRRRNRSEKSEFLTKILNKSKQGELVYLDLSQEEVTVQEEALASPPANHDLTFASRLQDILKSCRHEDKSKLPTSDKKSKRKLFTLQFGDEDFGGFKQLTDDKENLLKTDNANDKKDEVLDDNGNTPFDYLGRPKLFNDVINKPVEAIKSRGNPIFPLTPSPKKKVPKSVTTNSKSTPKTETNNEATTFKTPLAVKTKTKQSSAVKNFFSTPNFKYSFLKSLDVTVSKTLCHPDALHYRDNYRTKKEDLSKILYDIYNEKLFDHKLEVPLIWNKKLLNTAGRCLNKKKLGTRISVVELSEKVLTSADRLRCTLIHELCHAATWIFNGEGGHGSTWKEWARKANAVFPDIPKIGVCHQYDIEYKYTYKCTLCAAKSHAHSKSKKVENIRCSYCHGAIEIFLNKKDKDGNVIPTPVKEATGFAKFVKDNYKNYKRDDLKHADVMKLLSNAFASLKVTSN